MHGVWLADDQLLRHADRRNPGRPAPRPARPWRPLRCALLLAQAWPDAILHVIRASGHQGSNEITERMFAAHRRLADAPQAIRPGPRGKKQLRRETGDP